MLQSSCGLDGVRLLPDLRLLAGEEQCQHTYRQT